MKKYRQGLLFFTSILMILFLASCSSVEVPSDVEMSDNPVLENEQSNEIPLLLMDEGLSQEMKMSQIRADLIRQNNGYSDGDIIKAIIELPEPSLIDVFLDNQYPQYKTVHEFAASYDGVAYIAKLRYKQDEMIKRLKNSNYITSVEHQYTTISNAIAVETSYGNFKKIEAYSSISRASISETYNLPKTVSNTETDAVRNIVDIYETGIFDSSSVDFNGEGTAVAILDSGFDITHSVFLAEPEKAIVNEDSISNVLSLLEASKNSSNLLVTDVYKTKKIPFAYDYADKDTEVDPSTSDHGTHVAGIIGGNDDVVTGVATHTQLVLLKVFPDEKEGAATPDILAALEDAVLLGVDAINMSLGTSCGFSRAKDSEGINEVYDKINASGISLIAAASNSYSSAYGGDNGNTNKVWNPDSSTVGAPSTYSASLSVASISGTLSNYIIGPDSQVLFFHESNSISGKANDFVKELGIEGTEDVVYEYVTVPGNGLRVNYLNIDVKGKIALVRRGNNTFEEKAAIAKEQGAIACIIYNNVSGDIIMSMGKTDHIPTISISKDNGEELAKYKTGKLTFNANYKAGPFMSDFSSWGPTPDLKLKPEITAHGGNITSSVPGGGYDQMSGTSMASPNMCGVVVLIRQYLKEKYPNLSSKEISDMAYQLLMSTATIALNEEGNPYSPRKQGAGLASLKDATSTPAYVTVDGTNKSKLELGDDSKRTGVYKMNFNVVNTSNSMVDYQIGLLGMTETVSSSDSDYVAEKATMLNGSIVVRINGAVVSDNIIHVEANSSLEVEVTYTIPQKDKDYIDASFPYGMYVEGFVTLTPSDNTSTTIDLNVPFLAFYGDWTEAPMFDKTYYEVESEAHDGSLDEEDKLKADYYATTPFGSYYSSFIIPLGSYIYEIDESLYQAIPATEEHIALSNLTGTIDGFGAIYGGLLRSAKSMHYTIVDSLTGECVYDYVDENAVKAYFGGAAVTPYFNYLKLHTSDLNLITNRQYQFKMVAEVDYGDGGFDTNARNTFEFSFYMDDEAPIILNATYDKTYDKTLKKDRYYINLSVFDNHYVQSITPIFLRQGEDSEMTYSMLSTPIPVYGEKGEVTKVRFEITDYLNELYSDEMMPNGLAFSIDDYALNTNIYVCELPGTRGGFKFTEDGTIDGENMNLVVGNVGEIIDLIPYLASSDSTISQGNDYLKYLTWTSANEKIAVVKEGQVYALSSGRVRITVYERMRNLSASITVLVNPKNNSINLAAITPETENLKGIRFSYFDTIYAHPSCNTNQDIGEIGSRKYLSLMDHDGNGSPMIDIYPGEIIKLSPVIDPWYLPESRYELRYSSTNESIATVDENGVVKALKKGNCTIRLNIIVDGKQSNMLATLKLSVQSEFVIEGMTLVAYKGMGGDVVIPDDEGIVYIGSFAFSLYEIDKNIPLPEDDYDANKIPGENYTIKSVTIPSGVQDIQKFAFANCYELTKVTLPDTIKFIRDNAFKNDSKLTTINMENVQAICSYAFTNCISLNNIDLSKTYSIAVQAFYGCSSLTEVDLSALRNSGKEIFANCTNLKSVKFSDDTKLSEGMFKNSGLESVNFGVKRIPAECFAECANLTSVVAKNDLIDLGYHAFADCTNLKSIDLQGSLRYLYDEVFLNCAKLENVSLPNSSFTVGNRVFANCTSLTSLEFKEDTLWLSAGKGILVDSNVSSFDTSLSKHYSSKDGVLMDLKEEVILLVAPIATLGDYVIPTSIKKVGAGAFSWMNSLTKLTIESSDLVLGDYAFANCEALTEVVLPESGIAISNEVFLGCSSLNKVDNLDQVISFGKSSFSNTSLTQVTIGDNAKVLDNAFAGINTLTNVSLGKNVSLNTGAFQNCGRLVEVNISENGSLTIGDEVFANDNQLTTINLSQASGKIGARAFYGTKLTSVDLSSIEEVGAMAFADCNMLSTVLFAKVKKIGAYAFASIVGDSNGTILSQVSLPDSLVSLGEGAFKGCKTLVSINIPDSIEAIEFNTFADCNALKTVEGATNILSVGANAFSNCNALESIDLSNVEFIGDYAFLNCASLREVDFASLEEVGFGAFASSGIQNINSALKLKKIEDYAFQSTALTSVSLPLLEVVKEGAFSNCTSLVDFAFTSNIKEIDISVFYYSNKLMHIYMLDHGQKKESGILNDYALIENNVLYKTNLAGNLVLVAVPAALNLENLVVKEGTSVIDPYAGNQNPFIKSIVLPDSLNTIGNFAFYGCNNLASVEFKSYIAPTLESSYVGGSQLNSTDPGYNKLHYFFDFLGTESGYFHFIDLVGKRNPIQMILPANEDAQGYDSIIYEVFFGSVSDAKRSDYIAKNTLTINFLKLIVQIPDVITLADEALILEVNALKNSMRQDLTVFGYSQEEVNQMNLKLETALLKIKELKLAISSDSLKALQAEINALDTTFKIENLEALRNLTTRIDSVSREEKNILDLRKYDLLVSSYSAYISNVNDEFKPVAEVVLASFDYRSLLIAVALSTSLAFAMAYLVSKKWF